MKQIRSPADRLLTRAEVAEVFHVSPSTVTRWAEAGKLPVVKTLGGHRRYNAKIIMELARQLITQEEVKMDKLAIDVPAMYGDHHVIEVRQILLQLSGVDDVYASSAFHVVEVSYDPAVILPEDIKARLGEAGYLGDLPMPLETGRPVSQDAERDKDIFFRHSAAFEQTKELVSFGQNVTNTGRALWPCPGIGPIPTPAPEEATHG